MCAEGRHGGHPGLLVSTSNGRRHDVEVDAQSADEWQRGGAGL